MENNLKLLSLTNDFIINEVLEGSCYVVRLINSYIGAKIYPNENRIDYFFIANETIYEGESIKVGREDLNKLQEFCELLMKEGDKE